MRKRGIVITVLVFLIVLFALVVKVAQFFQLYDDSLTKKQIFDLVTEKQSVLEQAVSDIKDLGPDVSCIANAKYKKIDKRPDIKGVYMHDALGYKELDNIALNDLLHNNKVKDISIYKGHTSAGFIGSDCIEFSCGGKGRDYYCGFYYSEAEQPLGFQGSKMNLVQYKNGWSYKEDNGDNEYYTEQIKDKWFYYEMIF